MFLNCACQEQQLHLRPSRNQSILNEGHRNKDINRILQQQKKEKKQRTGGSNRVNATRPHARVLLGVLKPTEYYGFPS